MATEVTIGGDGKLFVGEDNTIRLKLAQDMSGWTTVFDVRLKDTSTEAILSIVPVLTGVYSADPSTNTQRAIVQLTDDHTNLFKAKVYRWSWKRMDAGAETVLGRGDFAPEKSGAP